MDKANPTQFGRAMGELGIEMVPSYSPEARGRSERWFGTVQGRLPQELALAGITDMASANAFLREAFWPRMNRRFGVEAAEDGSAFVALGDVDLDDILCLKEERTVARDNCVGYRGRQLQLPVGHGRNYVGRRIRVYEHADGTLSVFPGPRRGALRRRRRAGGTGAAGGGVTDVRRNAAASAVSTRFAGPPLRCGLRVTRRMPRRGGWRRPGGYSRSSLTGCFTCVSQGTSATPSRGRGKPDRSRASKTGQIYLLSTRAPPALMTETRSCGTLTCRRCTTPFPSSQMCRGERRLAPVPLGESNSMGANGSVLVRTAASAAKPLRRRSMSPATTANGSRTWAS